MDFSFNQEQREWQMKARQFAEEQIRPISLARDQIADAASTWDWDIIKKGSKLGFRTLGVPKAWGGPGADLVTQCIVMAELARGDSAISKAFSQNWKWSQLIAVVCTKDQQERFLKPFLADDTYMLGGARTEPNVGSDHRMTPNSDPKTGFRLKAERDGDHFVVNGQKTWTSFAQYAQWCFALVRTDSTAPKHAGISFLLIDMASPGITLRPLKQISGESEFNETFFDNVRVPAENLVGDLNAGWKIAMTTLAYERGPEDALGRQIRFKRELDRLLATAAKVKRMGRPALQDPVLRDKLAKAIVDIEVMRLNCLRSFSKLLRGAPRGADAAGGLEWIGGARGV